MGRSIKLSDIQSFEYVEEDIVYDLSIQDNHNYYLENGLQENDLLVHNSSKTWDTFHLIATYCDHNRNKNKDIYVLRDTLKNSREYTFKEFKKCMILIGINAEYLSENSSPSVRLYGNNIYFRGLDDEANSEGYPSNVLFINEALETKKSQVNGLIMRCEELIIMDWNPKFTDHWCFDFEARSQLHITRVITETISI